jgi:hypothetical protein
MCPEASQTYSLVTALSPIVFCAPHEVCELKTALVTGNSLALTPLRVQFRPILGHSALIEAMRSMKIELLLRIVENGSNGPEIRHA